LGITSQIRKALPSKKLISLARVVEKPYRFLIELIEQKVTFQAFFEQANLNPNANLIKGVICGYRIEEIENPLTKQVRYLDKLVDELAKGRKMDKILRTI